MGLIIWKDFFFNKKNIYISLFATLAGTLCFAIDGGEYAGVFATSFVPLFTFNFMIGKMCYMEEKDNAYKYLKALPFDSRWIVSSKYVVSLIVLLLTYIISGIEFFVLKITNYRSITIDKTITVYLLGLLIFYFSFYLYINFKFNYSVANQSIIIFWFGIIGIVKISQSIKIDFNINEIISQRYFQVVFLATSLLVFYISQKLSSKAFVEKE